MSTTESEFITCHCTSCKGHIEFPITHAGISVDCPHCQTTTLLYIPQSVEPTVSTGHPPQSPAASANRNPPSPLIGDEYVFLYEAGVIVAKTRFMASGQTFAMANITSVAVGQIPPSYGGAVTLCLLGLLIAGIGAKYVAAIVIGLALFGLGVWVGVAEKATYVVVLTTASGEVKTCHSQDGDLINRIVSALNQAIVARG